MSLSCYCDDGDFSWYFEADDRRQFRAVQVQARLCARHGPPSSVDQSTTKRREGIERKKGETVDEIGMAGMIYHTDKRGFQSASFPGDLKLPARVAE